MAQIKLNGTEVEYNNIYYIAVDGSDTTGDGTKEKPFASYNKAFSLATNNDLIYFIKGNYLITNLTTIYSTYFSAFLYDQGKQLTIYAEPFTYINIDNPTSSVRDRGCISLRNANTKVIGFIIRWAAPVISGKNNMIFCYSADNYALQGKIYNCHFIIQYPTDFSYANFNNTLQVINCQFDILATPYNTAYGAGANARHTTFINCTMNLSSWDSAWGIVTTSTILVNQSYNSKYKLIVYNDTYGIYNGLYKYISELYLLFDNNKYKYIDENDNTITINNIDDLLNVFEAYGMATLTKISLPIINTLENNKFNIKLLK